jgi:hypothetical protein
MMSKKMKKIRVEVIAEAKVSAEYYPDMTNEQIAELEKHQWHEWILDNVISEDITVTDKEIEE